MLPPDSFRFIEATAKVTGTIPDFASAIHTVLLKEQECWGISPGDGSTCRKYGNTDQRAYMYD